ncbi:C-type lectin domain family 4 member M-like [Asterias amurensis]|uniref:C-type lectin domain family 4 member M-like n=1 Tax=Asterias amurensis TaxID=7602 RepID=UPI003AB2B840
MHDVVVTWEEGKQICVELGGMMVVPQSEEELQHIINMCSCQAWPWFWIGCNDIQTEGTWVCLDGEIFDVQDEMWSDSEPNNSNNEDCAVGVGSGWFDWQCDRTSKSICQRHASPAQQLM